MIEIASELFIPLKENPVWLPLKDLFLKRKIEFEIDLMMIKNFFELNKINFNFTY